MYFAHYRNGETKLLQTIIRFGNTISNSADQQQRWAEAYRSVLRQLIDSPTIAFAFRINLSPNRLERLLFLTVNEEQQAEAESLATLFNELNSVIQGSVQIGASADQHDEMTSAVPVARAWVQSEPADSNDCELVHDFRAFPVIEQLLSTAIGRRWSVTYQLNVNRFRSTAEVVRQVKKNLIRVNSNKSFPDGLVNLQRRIVDNLSESRFIIDEFLAFDDDDVARFFSEAIHQEYDRSTGSLGFTASPLCEDRQGLFDEPLYTGFHSSMFEPSSPMMQAAMAATSDEVLQVMAWEPSTWMVSRIAADASKSADADSSGGYAKAETESGHETVKKIDVFISSKSADYEYAEQVFDFLTSNGINAFFSQETLPELGSSDYRKQIDTALDQTSHMIVVTSAIENVQSAWVEAEWGFFVNEKRSGRKHGNLITLNVGDVSISDLPPSLRYYEVIPFSPDSLDKLLCFVS